MLLPTSSTDEWILTLAHDRVGFPAAKAALAPMIDAVTAKFGTDWTPAARRKATALARRCVALAAERYLKNFWQTRRVKFSAYYTWYLEQIVNHVDPETGELPKQVADRINVGQKP